MNGSSFWQTPFRTGPEREPLTPPQGWEPRGNPVGPAGPPPLESGARAGFGDVKARVHRQLLDRLNLANLETLSRTDASSAIRQVVHELLNGEAVPLNYDERERLVTQVLDEIFGLGPLQPLMEDPEISDILVNTHQQVYVERRGRLEPTTVRFQDDKHLLQVIDRIVSAVGRRIDEASPMVDARLPDGSRVNAIIPPVAVDGPHLSIRKFKQDALTGKDLLGYDTLSEPMLRLLEGVVAAKMNILISGGTGAGKTTLLNVLSSFIPANERIVTIEDSAELQLQQSHVARLETRPANIEGRGEIAQRDLVKNALRMRPDRIIVGEVRAGEAFDMLQAMNTGHDGSMTTVHANNPRDSLSRVEQMIGMSGIDIPARSARAQIASAINVVIQVSRLADGRRKLTSLSEITGMEGDVVTMQEIFRFRQTGTDGDGQVQGRFEATGIRPRFMDTALSHGISLNADLFRPDTRIEAK